MEQLSYRRATAETCQNPHRPQLTMGQQPEKEQEECTCSGFTHPRQKPQSGPNLLGYRRAELRGRRQVPLWGGKQRQSQEHSQWIVLIFG